MGGDESLQSRLTLAAYSLAVTNDSLGQRSLSAHSAYCGLSKPDPNTTAAATASLVKRSAAGTCATVVACTWLNCSQP